jgi:hypothetical protein
LSCDTPAYLASVKIQRLDPIVTGPNHDNPGTRRGDRNRFSAEIARPLQATASIPGKQETVTTCRKQSPFDACHAAAETLGVAILKTAFTSREIKAVEHAAAGGNKQFTLKYRRRKALADFIKTCPPKHAQLIANR